MIDFDKYWKLAYYLKADAVRLQPNVFFNSLPYHFLNMSTNDEGLFKQLPESEYTISMATSIWRREYFLDCMTPGLDPWQLERTRPELGDIYFIPELPFWYINGTVKGALTKEGAEMI